MNLHIYYLHYNAQEFESRSRDPNKRRPEWFGYNVCLVNVLESISGRNFPGTVHFTLWYDGKLTSNSLSREVLAAIRNAEQAGVRFSVLCGEFGSGAKSAYDLNIHLLHHTEIADDDLIYTLENDYLHQPDWLGKVTELVQSAVPHHYISLYDHADNYHLSVHRNFRTQMFHTRTQLWRTAFSTCHSKLCRFRTLKEDVAIHTKYDDYLACSMLALKERVLMVATPGLATHAMVGLESPGVDWDRVAQGASLPA